MERAGYQSAQDAADQVDADLAADLHSQEVMGSHPGRPTQAEAVAAGATPASGEGHGAQ
jgi:hypothetical protein